MTDGPRVGEGPRKKFISGLVLDRELSPRERLGSNHIRQLVEALKSSATPPPIVVDRTTSRVVDGFHRVEACRRVFGREAMIEIVEKDYADKGELFLDAVRLNSGHGIRLAPYDQLRCMMIAERLSIDTSRMAGALSVRPSYVGELRTRRMGAQLASRSPVPLKRTIEHMKGKSLTPTQVQANQKLGGQSQLFYVNQINLLVENGLVNLESRALREGLRRLLENLQGLDLSEKQE